MDQQHQQYQQHQQHQHDGLMDQQHQQHHQHQQHQQHQHDGLMDQQHQQHQDDGVILSLSLVYEVFEYIHSDMKRIIHRQQQVGKLPLTLIMRSGLEDYFKGVLLGTKFTGLLCDYSAKSGYLITLKWAVKNGCPWDERTSLAAARGGHLETLKWAVENGRPWDKSTCSAAAGGGHLETLKWAREKDCPWDASTCDAAARGGHLETLKWAREKDCPWDASTCDAAAEGGHLETLKWAVENGCDFDTHELETYCDLAKKGRLDILKYAVANGLHLYYDIVESALYAGHSHIVKWAIKSGAEMEFFWYNSPEVKNICQEATEIGDWDIVHLAIEYGCRCPWDVKYKLRSMKLQEELADIQNDLSTIHETDNIKQKVSNIQQKLTNTKDIYYYLP